MKILSKSHHRNGVSGAPFDIFIFTDPETEDGKPMLAVDFKGDRFAVLEIGRLAQLDIAFGSNSWRGDHYADAVRALAKDKEDSVAEGAFFVRWNV